MNRRAFLRGLLASAAAIPVARVFLPIEAAPLYEGYVGTWEGIIFRETLSIDLIERAKEMLRNNKIPEFEPGWYAMPVHHSWNAYLAKRGYLEQLR